MTAKADQGAETTVIRQGDERYPSTLRNFFGKRLGTVTAIGTTELLNASALALSYAAPRSKPPKTPKNLNLVGGAVLI
jgi:hypothetical protein